MDRKSKLGFLITSLVFLVMVFALWRNFDARQATKERNYDECAQDATIMVAEFLRTNQTHRTDSEKGRFVRLAGSGFSAPGPWNLEGQFYLSMDRTMVFERGADRLQIRIFKGTKTGVFQPYPEHLMIYVTTPKLPAN